MNQPGRLTPPAGGRPRGRAGGGCAIAGKTHFDAFSDEHASTAFNDEQQIIRTGEPIVGMVERETNGGAAGLVGFRPPRCRCGPCPLPARPMARETAQAGRAAAIAGDGQGQRARIARIGDELRR